MALTITRRNEAGPFVLDRMRGVVVDITFDSSYLTTGEILTGKDLGFVKVLGGVCIGVRTAAGAAAATMIIPIYNPITGSLQAYETGDTVSTPLDEVGSTEDVSANVYTMIFFGV